MGYLDSLLAALDLLNLGLGQGDPLPNGLQLAPAQLYSLGDPATKKIIGVGAVPQAPTASCTPPASKSKPSKPRAFKKVLPACQSQSWNCPGDLSKNYPT